MMIFICHLMKCFIFNLEFVTLLVPSVLSGAYRKPPAETDTIKHQSLQEALTAIC